MINKSVVLDDIKNVSDELYFVQVEVENLKTDEDGEVDTSLVIKYIEDVKDALNRLKDSFEEYDDEVSDIGDDLEGLINRLSEVIK